MDAQKEHSAHNTYEKDGPERVSVISNAGEVDYLKVAGLKRIKRLSVPSCLGETKKGDLSPCELRRSPITRCDCCVFAAVKRRTLT